METQNRLSRHNKFISAENISILSVSSDGYLHASLSSQDAPIAIVIVVGNGQSDSCSKSEQSYLHLTKHIYLWKLYKSNYSLSIDK